MNKWQGGLFLTACLTGFMYCPGMEPVGFAQSAQMTTVGDEQTLERAEKLNGQVGELYQQGRYTEAIPLAEEALSIRESALGADHPDVATSLNNLAELYRVQGNYAEALPRFERALSIYESALGPDHPDVATSLDNLAVLYEKQGNYGVTFPRKSGHFR